MYPPTHISLPPPIVWSNDPPSPDIYFTPPTSPDVITDDPFPPPSDIAIDLAIDDDGLSTLEKIYLYSRSKAAFHRVFIVHALPAYLHNVTPQEAVEYVLPLLSGLAMDDDEPVKEALAAELVPIIWWFFAHCQIIPDDLKPEEAYASSSTTVTISVQAFTPILGTLLLSSNTRVGGAARYAVVDLLSRMKKADDKERGAFRHHPHRSPGEMIHPWEISKNSRDLDDDDEAPLQTGMFEILQQVVIGMGRLDVDYEPEQEPIEQPSMQIDRSNPYFPATPSSNPQQSRSNYASWYAAAASPEPSSTPARLSHPSTNAFSPGTEFPPPPPKSPSPMSPPERHTSGTIGPQMDEMYTEGGDDEQAAVGRLSSMSLMAAVTASGTLGGETQRAFVREVERVGHDPVYWVRREASFALGALAKVVPEEIVIKSLLPLYNALRWDVVWHVRHSALFALPALLARLSPAQRRTVALETVVALSADINETVRCGVLEALGEVIYTFHQDAEGPPEVLVHLFLGPKKDPSRTEKPHSPDSVPTPLELFHSDPKRPLICAFNFPAVALTLGGRRWSELRETYLDLTTDPTCGVRLTLAASLGELAKIIGTDNTQKDLLNVWWMYIDFEDEGVRTKALESLNDIIGVVGNEIGHTLVQGLLTRWDGGKLRGWRERETVLKNIGSWINRIGLGSAVLARGLLLKGLEDNVAAVREAAVMAIPEVWILFSSQQEVIHDLGGNVRQLATSTKYRRRMTFIASQQALALAVDGNGRPVISLADDDFLSVVASLADDTIEGVRIGVARFAAAIYSNLVRQSHAIPSILTDLVHRLSQDSSHEVQSYVVHLKPRRRSVPESDGSPTNARRSAKRLSQLSTFSRPPQPHLPAGTNRDEERSFSGDSACRDGSRRDLDGNASLVPEHMSHAGVPPPSFYGNAIMLNLLKTLRYFVFVIFVICNAIIISVAVWNMSIAEIILVDSAAKEIDGYLIFLGASGLLLTFLTLFSELSGKDVFLTRVWFELLWVGLFCIMNLVGAAVTTAYNGSQACDSRVLALLTSSQESPCASSSQVLQAFTWISAILLLGYFTLLFALTIIKRREDSSIWSYNVRKFPLMKGQALKSAPASPSLPRFRGQPPVIAAPRPRRIAAIRQAILSYRSGLSLDYEIEHYQTPDLAPVAAPARRTQKWTAPSPSPPPPVHAPVHQQPVFSSPFYHTSVQVAIEDQQPQPPPPVQQSQIRRLPPSPPPLGDWPRLDAASRPRTTKRKPLPQPLPPAQVEPIPPIQSRSGAVARLQPQPHPQPRARPPPPSQSRHPLPPHTASIPTSTSYIFDAPALSAALQPLASQPATARKSKSRPSGPRRPSDSMNDGRPPPLDLSSISSFRSPGFR
ncbi:hypothetical protein M413DRAFT_21488 [Hebeloma cylindrosporum]|uniref:TOG domain-containing protein n=1 Tax=Hebeloma cylindrosporum TaxID=76867 RepID=A0A0C3CZF8_HEBCY|nr:hypothetical protein M413DRAFT_21488 [Hebeloma cylindrosporum h7]